MEHRSVEDHWQVDAPWSAARSRRIFPGITRSIALLIAVIVLIPFPARAAWQVVNTGTTQNLRGVWVAPDETAFAVGDGGTTLKFSNSQWTPLSSGVTANLFDVWGSSSSSVVASGVGTVLFYNGASWSDINQGRGDPAAIIVPAWISPNGKSIFVCRRSPPGGLGAPTCVLDRYDTTTNQWNVFGLTTEPILAFCGTDNQVTAVDDKGNITAYDNTLAGTPVLASQTLTLGAAWMDPNNCNDAFAVDNVSHVVYHFNGTAWVDMNAGIPETLFGLHGTAGNNVYAAGVDGSGNGVVWHYDGSAWTQETIPSIPGLIDVAIGSGVAAGEAGTSLVDLLLGGGSGGGGGAGANLFNIGNFQLTATAVDPVSTFNGELFERLPADINRGGPMPLVFSRYYGSNLAADSISGALGVNWRHNFEWQLSSTATTTTIFSQLGRTISFTKSGGLWSLSGRQDIPYQLAENAGIFTLLDPRDQRSYRFNASGQLTNIEDGRGNIHTLTYNGSGQLTQVADGLGRSLALSYDGAGKLTAVTADGGRTVTFAYSGGDLTSATDTRGQVTTYAYAAGSLLTGTTRPAGNTPFTQTWDVSKRVTSQINATAQTTTLAYAGNDTTITDPQSNSRVHTHTPNGELASSQDQLGNKVLVGSDTTGRRNSITDRLGDVTTMSYHAPSGKLASRTHADGTTTSFSYTARTVNGNTAYDLTGITHADNTTESLSYDSLGNPLSHTDQLGNTTSATYNGNGQVLTRTNRLGGVRANTYNPDATLATTTDPAGNTTTLGYDTLRRPNLITQADGSTRSATYDPADHPLTLTDENGHTTTLGYDANGNLASVQDALAKTTTLAYDGNDRRVSVTDPLGGVLGQSFDALNRVAMVTDANGNAVSFAYDKLNHMSAITDPLGNVWPLSFDTEGIITSAADPLGHVSTFASDKMGRITRQTTPLGNVTHLSYDALGRIVSATDPLNQTVTLSRDARGRVTGVTLPGGVISTSLTRNAAGEVTVATDPNGNLWSSAYDSSGRRTSHTDPLGQTRAISYDNRNRPSVITFPGSLGAQTRSYDGVGNLTSVSYSDGTAFVFSYDANNRLIAANNGGTTPNNLTRGYDANGRLSTSNGIAITRDAGGRITAMTLAAGKTVHYAYDANGQVTSVSDWNSGATTFSYDQAGRLMAITRPNGVNGSYTWDDDARLIGLSEGSAVNITLTRDARGQITAATRTVPRKASAATLGNRSHSFDAASQIAGNTYDALGRQTAAGADSYSWDGASRLSSYILSGATVSHSYDALGRRTKRTAVGSSSEYVWNDALARPVISVERRGGADFRYFIHTPGGALLYSIDAATGARRFYHFDEMGNTLFISDDVGTTLGSYAYTPYGELIASTGTLDNPFTWQGEQGLMDEGNGLYYDLARFYDSSSGRFLSRDPIRRVGPRSINPYQYAYNNPLRYVDATGLSPVIDIGQRTSYVNDISATPAEDKNALEIFKLSLLVPRVNKYQREVEERGLLEIYTRTLLEPRAETSHREAARDPTVKQPSAGQAPIAHGLSAFPFGIPGPSFVVFIDPIRDFTREDSSTEPDERDLVKRILGVDDDDNSQGSEERSDSSRRAFSKAFNILLSPLEDNSTAPVKLPIVFRGKDFVIRSDGEIDFPPLKLDDDDILQDSSEGLDSATDEALPLNVLS